MLHCSDPDLLMKAAADSDTRQRLSAQGQGHTADPVGPALTYLLAAQYEMSRTSLPCGRTNAKNILLGYIRTTVTAEGGTATLHPLVLYMAGVFFLFPCHVCMQSIFILSITFFSISGLCLDGFLEVRVTENEDGNPNECEKVCIFTCNCMYCMYVCTVCMYVCMYVYMHTGMHSKY